MCLYLSPIPSASRRSFKGAKTPCLENIANNTAVSLAVLAAAKREDDGRAEEDPFAAEQESRGRNEIRRTTHTKDWRLKVIDVVAQSPAQPGNPINGEPQCDANTRDPPS